VTVHRVVKQAARGAPPAQIARELLGLEGETLRDAVRALIFLGVLMEEAGQDASPIFALVESTPVIAALDRANATRVETEGDRAARAAKTFERFAGAELIRTAKKAAAGVRIETLGARRFAGLKLR
jgi:hypothetical protein